MEKKKNTGYIIPHTHWDREWRYPLWENRVYLRDLMEELITTLENNADYQCFLMDGQTAAIEDYLEICPDKREQVETLIRDGRIDIGPWYTLLDLYPISGESMIRNLLEGRKHALKLGKCLEIGYESFGWGQPSQLPQIYQGFGIDTVIVSKNVDKTRAPESEFWWIGADGTKVLATRLGNDARANFFMNAYLKIMTGKDYKSDDYAYQHGVDGQVYHQADETGSGEDYFRLEETEQIHKEFVVDAAQKAWDGMQDSILKEDRAMLDGTDSTTAQPKLMELLKELNAQCENTIYKSSSMGEYVQIMKEKLPLDSLREIHGEMRDGPTTSLSGNALMTRPHIKALNKKVESHIFGMAEPMEAILYMLGEEYEEVLLSKAQNYLLQSHPHDSINGVTQDKTVNDVLYRLSQADEIANAVYNKALRKLVSNLQLEKYSSDDILLVLFNPTAKPRKEIVKVFLDTPQDKNIWDFSIADETGKLHEIQELSRYENVSPVVHLQSRPYPYYTDRHEIYLETGELPAGGYRVYHVVNADTFNRKTKFWAKTRKTKGLEIATAVDAMENENLKVTVNQDGSVSILDKRSGRSYGPCNYFESTGDVGDYWMYYPPYHNRTYTSKGLQAEIFLKENGPLSATIGVNILMELPAEGSRPENYIHGDSKRSEYESKVKITSYYTLTKDAVGLMVDTEIENHCKDHRMSMLMDTKVKAEQVDAQGHFVIDHRNRIPRRDMTGAYYNELTTQPMQNIVSVEDEYGGFAVVSDTLGEYEYRSGQAMACTLFRAVRNIICTEFRSEGSFPNQQGGQLQQTLQYRYIFVPRVAGEKPQELAGLAERLKVPVKPVQTTVSKKRLGTLPDVCSFYEVKGNVEVSCMKKAENKEGLILRLYNLYETEETALLQFEKEVLKAEITDLKEDTKRVLNTKTNQITLTLQKNQIVTVHVMFASDKQEALK